MASIKPCSDGRATAEEAGFEDEDPYDFPPGIGDALPTTWMVLPFRMEYAPRGKVSPFITAPEWISLKEAGGRWMCSEMALRKSPNVVSGGGSGKCSRSAPHFTRMDIFGFPLAGAPRNTKKPLTTTIAATAPVGRR